MPVNSFADKLVKKVFGSSSSIFLKKVAPTIAEINGWEAKIEKLSDDELKAQTQKFKDIIRERLAKFDSSPEGHSEDAPELASHGSTKVPKEVKTGVERLSRKCSTNCCPKRSRPFARLRGGLQGCVTSTCR